MGICAKPFNTKVVGRVEKYPIIDTYTKFDRLIIYSQIGWIWSTISINNNSTYVFWAWWLYFSLWTAHSGKCSEKSKRRARHTCHNRDVVCCAPSPRSRDIHTCLDRPRWLLASPENSQSAFVRILSDRLIYNLVEGEPRLLGHKEKSQGEGSSSFSFSLVVARDKTAILTTCQGS